MKKLGTIIVIAFAIWFAYTKWEDLDANTLATVFTGLVIIYGYSETKKREIEARHFIEKKNAYGDFISMLSEVLKGEQGDTPITPEELFEGMYNFRRELIVWGGTDTINAFDEYIKIAEADEKAKLNNEPILNPHAPLLAIDNLFRSMRKELGHDNHRLEKGSVVGVFLNQEGKEQLKKSG